MAAKTVEEIKAEIVSLVKSQGNQGAISLGTVLDDITELAGEGGGGGGSTIGGYPVVEVPLQLDAITKSPLDEAVITILDPDISAKVAAAIQDGDVFYALLRIKNWTPAAKDSNLNMLGNLNGLPALIQCFVLPYESGGKTVRECYIAWSHVLSIGGGFKEFRLGAYINIENGEESNYAWLEIS